MTRPTTTSPRGAPPLPIDPGLAERVAAMRGAFDVAARNDARELRLVLGGRPVRLRTVGATLTSCTHRAVAHLAGAADEETRLTIDLWDEGETGVPAAGCGADDALGINPIISASPDGRLLRIRHARSDVTYDRAAGAIVGWSDHRGRVPLGAQGRPLQVPLAFWHCDAGMQVMHAGMVARDGAGVLFPGMGGSGKSTTSLCCLEAGLDYLGDDYIALERRPDDTHVGHGLYGSCFLEPDHLRRFPRLLPHAIASSFEYEDKWLTMLPEIYPGRLSASGNIRAIALPTVVDAPVSRHVPISAARALLALAPSSIVMVPGRGAAELEPLAALVASVPCFRLELGRDLASIAPAVHAILDEVTDP